MVTKGKKQPSRKQTSRKPRRKGSDKKVGYVEKYDAVVANAELANIMLVASKFDIQPGYFQFRDLPDNDSRKAQFTFDWKIHDVGFYPDTGLLGANFDWIVIIKQGKKHLFKLSCSYLCFYTGLEGHDKKAAKAFIERVGLFAAYPYFRNHVSHISWAANARLPLMPMLREVRKKSQTVSRKK